MHIQRNIDKILCNGLADKVTLFVRRKLQQLLAEVITEWI